MSVTMESEKNEKTTRLAFSNTVAYKLPKQDPKGSKTDLIPTDIPFSATENTHDTTTSKPEAKENKKSVRIIWRVRVAQSYGGQTPLRATSTHFFSSREKAHAALFGAIDANLALDWKKVSNDFELRVQFAQNGLRYDCWLDKVEHTALIDAVDSNCLLKDNINVAYNNSCNRTKVN